MIQGFPVRVLLVLCCCLGLVGTLAAPATACSPVPYLFQLLSAGSPFGGLFLHDTIGLLTPGLPARGRATTDVPAETHPERRLPWFLHPLALTLYLTVLLKTFFIRRWLAPERRYGGLVLPVALANALSTLPVVLFGLLYAAPVLLIPGLFIAVVLMRRPAAMLSAGWWEGNRRVTGLLQFLLGISFLVNIILLGLAQDELLGGGSLVLYWLYKILFCTYTVATGLFITSAMEGWVLAHFLRPAPDGGGDFIRQLVRCNGFALLALFALAAALVLPLRFASPDWLI